MTDSESPSPGHDSDTFDRNGSPLSDVSSPAGATHQDSDSLTDTEASLKAQLAGFVASQEPTTQAVAPATTTTSAPSTNRTLTPAQSLARKLSEKPPTKLYKKTQTARRRSPPVATNGPIAIAPAPVLRPLLPKPVVPIRPKKRTKSVNGAVSVPAAAPVRRKTSVPSTISPSSLSLPSKRKSSDVSTDSSLDMMLTPATTLDMSLDMSLSLDISQPNLDFWPDDLEWQEEGLVQQKELDLEDIFYDLDAQIIAWYLLT